MLIILLFFISFSASALPPVPIPPAGFQDNFWQQVQIQDQQRQQQLQFQDQYRRQLLLQDQQRQIQQLHDQQDQIEYMQRNLIMHQHYDQLMQESNYGKARKKAVKKKFK